MGASRARVLVVDDEEIIRILLGHALREYDLTIVDCVSAALEALRRGSFDAVVTDKNLPDGDGAAVCQAARRGAGGTAIVVITGYASSHSAEEFLRLDVDDYIPKPFDIDDLRKRLETALRLRSGAERSRKPEAAPPPAPAPAPPRILLVEPEESDRVALTRALEQMGCEVVVGTDPLAALRADSTLAGAVLNRKLCSEAVKSEVVRQKVQSPSFRLVVTVDNRALNETVASILVGAVGQLARPISEEEARAALATVFGLAS